MTNDVAETNPEESVACFALSTNDSYVMSASGGKISLFNMMTFKEYVDVVDNKKNWCINGERRDDEDDVFRMEFPLMYSFYLRIPYGTLVLILTNMYSYKNISKLFRII